MRKLILTGICLLTALFNLYSQQLPGGIIGYWPLDGNADDFSSYGYNGQVNGATTTTDRNGTPGLAYHFDGNSHINISGLPAITDGFTISLWMKADATQTNTWPTILAYQDNTYGLLLEMIEDVQVYAQGAWDWEWQAQPGTQIALDTQWQHVLVTWSASTGLLKYYKNGVETYSRSTTTNNLTGLGSGSELKIAIRGEGGKNQNLDYPFVGDIDEVMLFNRALTPSEITQVNSYTLNTQTPCGESIYCINGTVGIGTSTTKGYKLAVAGKVIAEEIKVAKVANWPDYVFAKNYPLKGLDIVESYIENNKRLPDMPSTEEVNEKGISLGKMNAALLKKIEELTLYLIDQNKDLKEANKKIAALEKSVSELKNKAGSTGSK